MQQNDDLRNSRNNSTWKNLSSVLEVKLVLLGTTDVGKTSISQRYCMGTFQDSSKPTVGGSFLAKTIVVEGIKLKLQIWDTAGQERFRSLAPMYYRGAAAAILVFDILNYDSFEKVKDWVRELRFNNQEDLILSVVGNKIDLEEQREVQRQEAADYSLSIGASYHETSAKDNKGIEELFIQIGKKLHQRQLEKPIQYSSHFNDDKNLVHPSSNPRLNNNANSSNNQNANSNSNSCYNPFNNNKKNNNNNNDNNNNNNNLIIILINNKNDNNNNNNNNNNKIMIIR